MSNTTTFPSPIGTPAWIEARNSKHRPIHSNGMTQIEWLVHRAERYRTDRNRTPTRTVENILTSLSARRQNNGFQVKISKYLPRQAEVSRVISKFKELDAELQRKVLLAFVNEAVRFTNQEIATLRKAMLIERDSLHWSSEAPKALEAVFYNDPNTERPNFLKSKDF